MSQPLISVIIPVYNVEKFVKEAINSVRSQTYKNLEIIIINDASSDSTLSIIEELAKKDSRISILSNHKNLGIVESLNHALNQAKGEYIARMDGDDISHPQKIEKQFIFLQENPTVDIVGVNIIVIDEDGNEIHKEEKLTDSVSIVKASKYVSPLGHNWLTKKDVYEKLNNYRITSAEDLDFLLRALDSGFKLANTPEYLYYLRQRNGNTSTRIGLKQMKSIFYVRELHKERNKNKSSTNTDSYSDSNLEQKIKYSSLENYLFQISANLHLKYLNKKPTNLMVAIAYRIISIIFSPHYQLTWIYNGWRYKLLLKNSKTNKK